MSYALSAALQAAVHARLSGDAALGALIGGHVHDAPPAGKLPPLYVLIGPERVRDRSDASGPGAEHDLTVTVAGEAGSFRAAKEAAAAVSAALLDPPLALDAGRLLHLSFRRARAARGPRGRGRRIDLTFRARVAPE